MASIQKITEFKAGREALSDTHYTVYYDTGRRVNYYGRDTLPMTVVNFLTDENTVSETVYIDDNYLHCVNSRTTYTPAEETTETAEQVEETETEETEAETIEETAEEAKEVVTMKKYFKVTFEYAEDIYCTNLAHAETAEDVEREYSKYPWKSIKEAQPWDVDEAKMKGMPFIEVEAAQQPQEAPQEAPAAEAEQQPTETAEAAQAAHAARQADPTDTTTDTEEEEEDKTMSDTERYDYLEHMTADVIDAIKERYTPDEIREHLDDDRDDFAQELNDDLWTDDSVTGNASGSYYCNAWRAEEAIAHNWDLIADMIDEFDAADILRKGPEAIDVSIRCYLLGQAIEAALDQLDDEIPETEDTEDDEDAADNIPA